MKQEPLRFRQVHLDFHTSEHIAGIGEKFDKKQWQAALKAGHVDSVTVFARCHHGWCYYPTKAGQVHPHLTFDLLKAQIEASHEIGVKTPVYITVGWDELYARAHQGELCVDKDGLDARVVGWKRIAFNTPYVDYLCDIITEVVRDYDADGIFLDIVGLYPDVSLFSQMQMREMGLDPENNADIMKFAAFAQEEYFKAANKAIQKIKPGMRIFHNAGHIPKGDTTFLKYATHLELESLPTGGWGYDHFPLSAKYCATLKGVEFLGMTGKFHTSWGEFGGFKHINALRYECAAMIAYGARCSVGDQLHPSGEMNMDTYERLGAAYAEVEAKEPWCTNVEPVSEIGILSMEALNRESVIDPHLADRNSKGDTGASRMLLERQVMFDVLDTEADFEKYKLIIVPDDGRLNPEMAKKLKAYIKKGGKLLLSGESGLMKDKDAYAFDLGTHKGHSEFDVDYYQARKSLLKLDTDKRLVASPFVAFGGSALVKPAKGATVLADLVEPYFSRTLAHFCSHQHAPDAKKSGYPAAFINAAGNILTFPPKIFAQYADRAQPLYRDMVMLGIEMLLDEKPSVQTSLQSAGRVSLMQQRKHKRYVLHLMYASPIKRGSNVFPKWDIKDIEVIEDIPTLNDIAVTVRTPQPVKSVKLAPSGEKLDFTAEGDSANFTVPSLNCHQMVELGY